MGDSGEWDRSSLFYRTRQRALHFKVLQACVFAKVRASQVFNRETRGSSRPEGRQTVILSSQIALLLHLWSCEPERWDLDREERLCRLSAHAVVPDVRGLFWATEEALRRAPGAVATEAGGRSGGRRFESNWQFLLARIFRVDSVNFVLSVFLCFLWILAEATMARKITIWMKCCIKQHTW